MRLCIHGCCVLLACVWCRAKAEDFRRIWVFTNDDEPTKGDATERRAAIQRAKVNEGSVLCRTVCVLDVTTHVAVCSDAMCLCVVTQCLWLCVATCVAV